MVRLQAEQASLGRIFGGLVGAAACPPFDSSRVLMWCSYFQLLGGQVPNAKWYSTVNTCCSSRCSLHFWIIYIPHACSALNRFPSITFILVDWKDWIVYVQYRGTRNIYLHFAPGSFCSGFNSTPPEKPTTGGHVHRFGSPMPCKGHNASLLKCTSERMHYVGRIYSLVYLDLPVQKANKGPWAAPVMCLKLAV
jgi:hypothetical protein